LGGIEDFLGSRLKEEKEDCCRTSWFLDRLVELVTPKPRQVYLIIVKFPKLSSIQL
jgi:hypothetical protein